LNHLDKSLSKLDKSIDKLFPDESNNREDPNYWKGKNVIPLNDWKKIANTNYAFQHGVEYQKTKEALQYFPDDFTEWLFPLGVQDTLQEKANRWYSDYIELMEQRKNAAYGKTKCRGCLLSPDREDAAIFIGINKVIARALERVEEKKPDNSNPNTIIYPCNILNRFQCPYDKKDDSYGSKANQNEGRGKVTSDVDILFDLSEIAFQVELAFGHAESMTTSNETIYEADFEAGEVKEFRADYYGNRYAWSSKHSLEEGLAKVKRLSRVPIRNVDDVYHALTDRETLDKLLDQGLEIGYQKCKNDLVVFFMTIRDKVRIEDLQVCDPVFISNKPKEKCSTCHEFANIYCTNHAVWICADHWREHKNNNHQHHSSEPRKNDLS
jgi:hypothetical protein